MDNEIAWEDCIPDLPLDSQELPPLNALSSAQPAPLPNIDLLDLLSFDTNASPDQPPHTPPPTASSPTTPPEHHTPDTALSPESLSRCTSPDLTASPPPHKPLSHTHHNHHIAVSPPPSVLSSSSSAAPPSQSSITTAPPSPPPHPVAVSTGTKPEPVSSTANTGATHTQKEQQAPPPQSHAEVVLELSTRLASATAEASALRKRVASLAAENRSLRGALDHANARLVAVAQAASAAPAPPAAPVMLGLTRMTAEAASRFGAALTVSDVSRNDGTPPASPPDRKKRKRVTGAATTMACVMFLWGALVGSPGWLSSSGTTRSDGNLPAVWKQEPSPANVPAVPAPRRPASAASGATDPGATWLPNCMRVLEPLPPSSNTVSSGKPTTVKEEATLEETVVRADDAEDDDDNKSVTDAQRPAKRVKTEHSGMFVDMRDRDAAATVRHSDARDPRHPQYSYVLCRDAQAAMDSVRSCASRMRSGETCGAPHTISLILPAEVVDGPDATAPSGARASNTPVLAEVQCAVMSVARIPVEHAHTKGGAATAAAGAGPVAKYGRVLATVPETGTVIRE